MNEYRASNTTASRWKQHQCPSADRWISMSLYPIERNTVLQRKGKDYDTDKWHRWTPSTPCWGEEARHIRERTHKPPFMRNARNGESHQKQLKAGQWLWGSGVIRELWQWWTCSTSGLWGWPHYQTVYLKWVHFIVCNLCLNQVDFKVWFFVWEQSFCTADKIQIWSCFYFSPHPYNY